MYWLKRNLGRPWKRVVLKYVKMFSFASSGQIWSGLSKQFFCFVFCSAPCFSFCLINYNSFCLVCLSYPNIANTDIYTLTLCACKMHWFRFASSKKNTAIKMWVSTKKIDVSVYPVSKWVINIFETKIKQVYGCSCCLKQA